MDFLKDLLPGTQHDYLAVTVPVWVVLFSVLEFARKMVGSRLKGLAQNTDTEWDDLVADLVLDTRHWFLLVFSAFVAIRTTAVPDRVGQIVTTAATLLMFLQVGLWGSMVIRHWVVAKSRRPLAGGTSATGFRVLGVIGRIVLWSIVLLLTLDNLGINITALVAGLGVGGVAVALALQNILGDIFCSITILLDKPFEVGDFIVVGDVAGEVMQVGIKTTRIKSLQGQEVVMSNADLVGSRINNYRRMQERRAVFGVRVVYSTPADKLAEIPKVIQQIVESIPRTRFDRAHFKAFGNFSLDFEAVYYVLDRDMKIYLDIQEQINLALYRKFGEMGIDFAFPTQTLFVHREPVAAS
ncbi:MAG: mechanosensitive ion channel family protein [Deltaproteobacteria bacterium]|nr:mechanosensitive ion channel family protein [Deltaproteobacteria bacterium]